ncbi:MAG: hypothetical protein K8S14_04245 [Actinomycetia bacterium]|nr:hypothetical protein [Actinomycetes bacterium]
MIKQAQFISLTLKHFSYYGMRILMWNISDDENPYKILSSLDEKAAVLDFSL